MTIALEDSLDAFANDPEFVAMFVDKATDLIGRIESDLSEFEESSAPQRVTLINQVFRAIHTIKGESGFVAMHNIGRLAHSFENVLDRARESQLEMSLEVVMKLMGSLDILRDLVGHIESSEQVDLSQTLAVLDGLGSGTVASSATPIVPAPPASDVGTATTAPRQTARKRTLIIDDEPLITRIVAQKLATAWIPSDSASSAEEALKLMRRNLYHVVVCDINLPGMSGVDLLPKLLEISPLVQVVMLTGNANLVTVLDSLTAGAVDFVPKTQDYNSLVEIVDYLLARVDRWIPLMKSRKER